MHLRPARAEDAAALALVGAATFLESYALVLPGRDLVAHCAKAHAPKVYADWIADPAYAVWTLEVGEGMVVGYAVLGPSVLPNARPDDLELRRIYVLAPFKGEGAGRRLMQAAIEEARMRGAKRLTLGMYGGNHAALAFYTRMGFGQIGTRTFQVGEKVCDDLVLGLDLKPLEYAP